MTRDDKAALSPAMVLALALVDQGRIRTRPGGGVRVEGGGAVRAATVYALRRRGLVKFVPDGRFSSRVVRV